MNNIIWTKDSCSFCSQAKTFLKERGIPYEERNISSNDWSKEDLLKDLPNAKTVPQIYLWNEYVGGYTDLLKYMEEHNM